MKSTLVAFVVLAGFVLAAFVLATFSSPLLFATEPVAIRLWPGEVPGEANFKAPVDT